ncbi:hypothetical protein ACFYO9_37635 [Streptomyces sp. NPDC005863]|uniref:hypothetical protein n=1 Tax=Streptomyces sp. NPDC005863 TaxID=3364735 RepID=UPI0036CB5A3F
MNPMSPTIPPDIAAHVLSHFGRGGYPAGGWTESLITLIDRADMSNRAKLVTAFPEVGAAVLLAKYDEEGIAKLQRLAGADTPKPQCPEALFSPDTGDLRSCVQNGRHDDHQAADGAQWRIGLDEATGVPW